MISSLKFFWLSTRAVEQPDTDLQTRTELSSGTPNDDQGIVNWGASMHGSPPVFLPSTDDVIADARRVSRASRSTDARRGLRRRTPKPSRSMLAALIKLLLTMTLLLSNVGVVPTVGAALQDDDPQQSRAGVQSDPGGADPTLPRHPRPADQVLTALSQAPSDHDALFTLGDALERYWIGVMVGSGVLLALLALTSRVLHLNKRLSRANTRLERRQQLILDSVAEGIYGVDLEGRATFVNKAMERMTGWRAEELIGNDQHEIIHHTRADGEPHPREECPVLATFRDNVPRFVDEDLFWRRNASSFPVEYSATPIRDEIGETIGSVVVFRDITERRRAAERISQHEAEQTHFSRLSTIGEMASGIAHELNQPLTAITTNARACVRLIDSNRADMTICANVMTKIAEQAERAGEVIRHIRRFVRKEQPEISPVAVADMFDTVLVLLRQDARRANVLLHQQIGAGADRVMAQRTQIEQVLLNLARNAVEAMSDQPRERRVLLVARRYHDAVEIRVVDTGPGLGELSPEHLFEAFVTTKAQGLGVGLSISTGIVEAHGGRLRVDSTAGIGATFYFSLPCAGAGLDSEPALASLEPTAGVLSKRETTHE